MRFVLVTILLTSSSSFAQRTTPIDNDQVRVLSVVDSPGPAGRMHQHAMNRVMIYLDEGSQRLTYEDGKVVDLNFKPGQVIWSPRGGMHTSQNTAAMPYRIVEVELKGKPKPFRAPALDPVKVHPAGYKVELDNSEVRVVRARMDPHQKIPLHEHALNRVVVFLEPAKVKVTPEGAAETQLTANAGEVRFSGPARHSEENLADQPFEVLVVELK